MSSIFGPESDGDSEADVPHMIYEDYEVGDFISFKKMNNEPICYGVISEILADTSEGKPYNIIYYDNTISDPIITTELRENVSPFSPVPIPQLRHYDGIFRMLYEVTKIDNPQAEIPPQILTELQGAFNTREGTFVTPESTPFNTPSVSRSTSYNDNSRSSSGGKRQRKRKNKTRRRNKKTKRRRNRKTKRR
jgi:hypothetical protein